MTLEEVMKLIDQYVRVEVQEANAHHDAPTEQTAMRRGLAMMLKTLLDDNALLGKTEQLLRKQIGAAQVLIAGLERRAIAHGKEREELAAQAADVAGERAANAALTAENERLRTPLTKEQIERALQFKPARADAKYLYATAREIERAHGICVA